MARVLPVAIVAALAAGCYTGAARPYDPEVFAGEPGWVSVGDVPHVVQEEAHACGDAVAAMLLQYWGEATTQEEVRAASGLSSDRGLTAGFLRDYLRERGMEAYLFEGTYADLEHEIAAGRPVVVGIAKPYTSRAYAHYQLVIGINPMLMQVLLLDPADGALVYSYEGFAAEWAPAGCLTLVASVRRPGV